MLVRLGLILSIAIALPGCNNSSGDDSSGDDSSGDDSSSDCADLRGSWEIDGTCGDDVCTISQAGCAITQVNCVSGARSTSGDIDGNHFSYTGTSGAGLPATCSGSLSGSAISGTCVTEGAGDCTFSGDRP